MDRQTTPLNLLPANKMIVKAMKIAYQMDKGNKHIVSLLVPQETASALRKHSDSSFQKIADVNESNTFIFTSTQVSELNVSGWHVLKDVCAEMNLQNASLINATNNRHRVSTFCASLNLPKHERHLFYTHVDHREHINKDIYRGPLAIMSIIKVGKQLMQIDSGECSNIFCTNFNDCVVDHHFFICDPVQVHMKKPSLCLRCKVCILISRFRY